MERKLKDELDELSAKLLGSRGQWRKALSRGYFEEEKRKDKGGREYSTKVQRHYSSPEDLRDKLAEVMAARVAGANRARRDAVLKHVGTFGEGSANPIRRLPQTETPAVKSTKPKE